MKDLKPIIVVTYACLVGTIILIIPAILEAKLQNFMHYNFKEWGSIFVLGFFGTVLGFVWFYEGIDKIGPSRAGVFINFVPIFATIFAILILGEKLVSSFIIGAVFIISGVYLTNYQAKKFPPKAGLSLNFVE
jgi:drug/metabolite transporter (DMT)-like permease